MEEYTAQRTPRCPYCGTLADIPFEDLLHYAADNMDVVKKYVDSAAHLPCKKTMEDGLFKKFDERTTSCNNEIEIKEIRHVKGKLFQKMHTRPRYAVSNRREKKYIEHGVYVCRCNAVIWSNPLENHAACYAERPGYDIMLSRIRQYILEKTEDAVKVHLDKDAVNRMLLQDSEMLAATIVAHRILGSFREEAKFAMQELMRRRMQDKNDFDFEKYIYDNVNDIKTSFPSVDYKQMKKEFMKNLVEKLFFRNREEPEEESDEKETETPDCSQEMMETVKELIS